jgi:serine/threonine protein kinase
MTSCPWAASLLSCTVSSHVLELPILMAMVLALYLRILWFFSGNRGSSRTPLDWVTRVKIALGAAKGLAYLHLQGGPKFVHANIKSSNILLNRELEACISDFGLAQLLTASSAASRIVGYRAPEVTETKKVTQKSDVYSFGVVSLFGSGNFSPKCCNESFVLMVANMVRVQLLLELLTGKAPTQAALNDEGIDLPRWVQSVVREEWTAEVFDLELMRYQNIEEEMVAMLQIAMQCVDPVPERRPKMNNVLLLLEDVHPFFIDNGDETSRQSESASEEKFRGSSDKDKTSQENTPSHSHTP